MTSLTLENINKGAYGTIVNEYQRVDALMYAASIGLQRYLAGDYSDWGGDSASMRNELQAIAADMQREILIVGGSAPALLQRHAAVVNAYKQIGIDLESYGRSISPLPNGDRNVELIGSQGNIIPSPSSSDEVDVLLQQNPPQQAAGQSPLASPLFPLLLLGGLAYLLSSRRF